MDSTTNDHHCRTDLQVYNNLYIDIWTVLQTIIAVEQIYCYKMYYAIYI